MLRKLGLVGAACATLVTLGACSSGGSDRYSDRYGYRDRYDSRYDDRYDRRRERSTVSERSRTYRDGRQVCRETEVVERDERSSDSGNRVAGTVAGAVVGGVIGHQIGSGRGNDAATVGGAAAGAYAGNQLAKDRGGKVRSREVTTECRRR